MREVDGRKIGGHPAILTVNMQSSSAPSYSSGLVWFRRDLRAEDHAALYHALTQCQQVFCAFVFDTDILDPLPRADRRVEFIREALVELDATLRTLAKDEHGGLITLHAAGAEAIAEQAERLDVQAVFTNHDDEPQAQQRDSAVRTRLAAQGRAFHTFKDHTVFERNEVLTQAGQPYSVFTPYKNAWLKKVNAFYLSSYPVERHAARLAARPSDLRKPVPSLQALGFQEAGLAQLKIPTGS